MKKINRSIFGIFFISFLLILSDQLSKFYFKGFHHFGIDHPGIGYYSVINVIGEKVRFVLVENPGMAFGISFGAGKIFLSLFSILAGVALAWLLTKIKNIHLGILIGFVLIFSGAVGNLIDRVFYGVIFNESPLFYGKVVDFIQVDIPDVKFLGLDYSHFPVFNIADSCVTVGVVFLLLFNKYLPTWEQITNKNIENIEVISESNTESENNL